MAPLTWRNVDSPSFASANELYSLSAELMNRGFSAASRGLDKFREITTDEQSARLMQDVMAAGNNPAAIQQAAAQGNAAFLSPEALRFANTQPGVLLDRQQAQANIGLTGIRSEASQYALDRTRVTDGRQDTQYEAQQAAAPLLFEADRLARSGELSASQSIIDQNAELLAAAGYNSNNLYSNLSGGFTGGMQDTQSGVQHQDFMRVAGNASNARELIDLAGQTFGTEAYARRGIQDLQAQGRISADLAQTALGSLGASGLWTAPTAADEIMQRYGAAPTSGRGSTNSEWAEGIGLVGSESGGNWNALNDEGYGGRLQFGADRLADAAAAGLVPAGTTGADFSRMSEKQQTAVEDWHFADIDRQASRLGLDQYYGQNIGGVVINRDTIRSMAHLGGIGGVQRFINSGGSYNPADSNGTRLTDYGQRFGNGTPLSYGSNVTRVGTQPGASTADQMLAAAANDTNRTPLTFGDGTSTPEIGLLAPVTDDNPVGSLMAAASGDTAPSEVSRETTPLVASPQAENDGGARANQMMAQVLAQPVEDVEPAQIVEAGTAGDNPLFTEVDGGVVARPPMSQQETQLIARAARAGILQTTPERATRQTEIDRASDMMQEASGIAPNANRPYLQPGGLLDDAGMVAAQTGEAVVNQGAEFLNAVNTPFRMLSEYALGRDYIGETGRVDWSGDGYSQSITSPITGTTRDNLTPGQRAALTGADQASNAMTAAISSNENGGQQPGQAPGQGQQPAATPTSPAPVKAEELASLLQSARSTDRVDRALNTFAPMDELLAGDNALSGDAATVAQQLTAEGGKLAYMDTRTVRENIRELMRIPGVNSASVAGALLAQNGVVYTGTDFNPLNWGSEDQIDADRAAEIWKQYQQPDKEGRTGIEAGVARLNNLGRSQSAVEGIQQVQADYEALVTAMNQQIAQAPNKAEKDAIQQHFEQNVFPLLYAQVQAIDATGALTTYSNPSTGR